MNFFKEVRDIKPGLRVTTSTNKVLEFDVEDNVSDADIKSALDYVFGEFGQPTQINVDGRTSELPDGKREEVISTRHRIFNTILDRGYKRKFQSPFTAVKSSRFKAVVSG
jgi:hypothetical protein